MSNFEKLKNVVAKLRDPQNGCPWDLKQTHSSLLKYLIEESYEFLDAVEANDSAKIAEELGDVLLQVLLHCQIGSESNSFDLESVSKILSEKLIRRHPHIFKKVEKGLSPDQVVEKWQEMKEKEKEGESRLSNSLLAFPALFSANKIGIKTNQIRFDWENATQVVDVVESEWKELKVEIQQGRQDKIQEELGDLLFSMAQLGRHLGLNPEMALRDANKKFLRRFQKMEELISNDGIELTTLNQKEMDRYWDKVKENEK